MMFLSTLQSGMQLVRTRTIEIIEIVQNLDRMSLRIRM
jgi:hypothetical protein